MGCRVSFRNSASRWVAGLVIEHSLNGCGEERHPDSNESLVDQVCKGLAASKQHRVNS